MSIFDGYRPDENYNGPKIAEGEHLLQVVKVVERISNNSGNKLLEIELVNKDKVRLFYHIVKNDWFNLNLTKFYDCFGIARTNQNPQSWIGSRGKAYIAKGKAQSNGKQYMEIKYLMVEPGKGSQHESSNVPPAASAAPSYPVGSTPRGSSDGFEDDIPF